MEKLTKDFKKFEMDVARYIFKKYISITSSGNSSQTDSIDDSNDSNDIDIELGIDLDETDIQSELKSELIHNLNIDERLESGIKSGISNKSEYKKYLKTIFYSDRKTGVINQITELQNDLDDMAKADSAYTRNADKFNPQLYDSLPDVMRCTYIRKHHHRYYRCKNKIANDDSDVCKKHLECENIYFDNYNDLVESITSK